MTQNEFVRRLPWFAPMVLALVLLALWEGLVHALQVPEYLVPAPSRILMTLAVDAPMLFEALGTTVAITLVALLFAVVHLNLPAILPILVMAVTLAFLYDRTQSIVPGIVAHGLNNAVALVLVYSRVAA